MEQKITTVSLAVKDDKYYADKALYQWNYGQILRITGADLPMAVEVGFSTTEKSGDSDVRVGAADNGVTTVAIPDKLFKEERSTDYSIYAFVYVTDENSGTTVHEIVIPVKARAKQGDPSEDPSIDPSIFEDAINAVNASAERAETAEKSAKESADKAKEYAESAGKSKGDVEKARDSAISAIGIEKESALSGIASKTNESVQKIQSQTEASQNSIKQSIADATEKKTELDGAISNATDAKGNLDKAVQSAGNAKSELDASVGKAGEAKTALDSSISSAGEKKLALDATVEQANTVDASLKEQIGSAEQIQANVEQIAKNKTDISSLNEDLDNIKKKKNVVIYVGSAELTDEQKLSCDYICDGVDDQIEINQAIDSLPDSGGEIHLSRGIFNISGNIVISKRIKLVGEGKSITLDRNNVNNGGTTLLTEQKGGSVILICASDTLSDIKGITLSDFQIVGAGINVEDNYCNGINIDTYTDCVTLERLAICHCFYGLFVGENGTIDDISITNCDFQRDNTGICIYGKGWQTRIENNIFWDMSGRVETSGIVLSAGENIVNGNYFGVSSLASQNTACAWISAKNSVSLTCNGNSFSRCTSNPIRFDAGGQFANISGNSFSGIGKASFQLHERAVLCVDGAGTGGGRISFTNNTVFWANGDDWKTSYLAYLTNQVAQVNISNNTIIDGIGKITEDELVYKSEDSVYAITIGNNVLC